MVVKRDVFQAVADPVRRDIIGLLADESKNIKMLASHFTISQQAISKHVKVLEESGIVSLEKQGRKTICSLLPEKLIPLYLWAEQYQKMWEVRIDSFEDYLATLKKT